MVTPYIGEISSLLLLNSTVDVNKMFTGNVKTQIIVIELCKN